MPCINLKLDFQNVNLGIKNIYGKILSAVTLIKRQNRADV